MSVLDRFLRYVRIDTRADDRSASCPSTPGQLALQRLLADELREIGLEDVDLDANGYLMATVPATVDRAVPTIGLVAHVDTSPEMPGNEVTPIVHERWDGRDIVLPDDPAAVLRASDDPDLAAQIGHDIVTASGRTLLGADDKAGVAAIVEAAAQLMARRDVPHGRIRVCFTPDEEIGRGADRFDVARFGAVCAYTLDGGVAGELEFESFSADVVLGLQHASGLCEGPDGERDQGGRAVRRSAAAAPVAGADGALRGFRPPVPGRGVGRSHVGARAAARLRHGDAARAPGARRASRARRRGGDGRRRRVRGHGAVPQHARGARRAPRGRRPGA
jgi:hypothetical protein